MLQYIALLRGINVSGQKIIKMDALKAMFESMPFHHVRTYIQSGNVMFDAAETDAEQLRASIEDMLKQALGYAVPVIVRSLTELEEAIRVCPFEVSQLREGEKVYVTFLAQPPALEAIQKLESYRNEVDDFQVRGKDVYVLCRGNYGRSQFSNTFLEKKLGAAATTRNWDTVLKLAEISRD
ncbi:DUF1697 domain-containing protein [Paenibacillus cremeus]|uniref:DUF1697 domain-containing protein n=1 Tax=Paenibacillus cremeus TaxID=2163881 RepID=A0A559JVS8_9BACL|nr:DUF1697 domain-containing protein [Paenibacillus cremeus]TVY03927.1 DUF1697 domain-containing protein [Paenibacillus cremeus]